MLMYNFLHHSNPCPLQLCGGGAGHSTLFVFLTVVPKCAHSGVGCCPLATVMDHMHEVVCVCESLSFFAGKRRQDSCKTFADCMR